MCVPLGVSSCMALFFFNSFFLFPACCWLLPCSRSEPSCLPQQQQKQQQQRQHRSSHQIANALLFFTNSTLVLTKPASSCFTHVSLSYPPLPPAEMNLSPKVVELCARINSDPERRIRINPSIGMHPEKADLGALEAMLGLIDEHAGSIVCVGEIGLDYSRHLIGEAGEKATEEAKEVQREVFSRQARRAEVRPLRLQWGINTWHG